MQTVERKPNTVLKRERLRRSWTQEQAAAALSQICVDEVRERGEINAKMVSRWETGENVPSLFYQQKLCMLYKQTPEELAFLVNNNERDFKKQDTARTNVQNVHGLHVDQGTQEITKIATLYSTTLREERVVVATMYGKDFSFGKLKTTETILDGDGIAVYLPQHIRTHYIPVAKELPEEFRARKERIQREQEEKKASGDPYHTPQEVCSFVFSHEPFAPGGLVCLYHALVHDFGRKEVDKIISS